MNEILTERWFKAAIIRSIKTTCQTLASTIPVGVMITPVMVQEADWTVIYAVLAWLATGLLSGIASLLTSLAGLPEVDDK